jgi:uncharacterized protein YdhG (YjbR/CyaY superfamily)
LRKLRQVVRETAPKAEEAIRYQMPTYILNGNLIHFAAYEHHIGFYPTPSGVTAFKKELNNYKTAKGSIQFPITEPIPLNLVKKITKFRVAEALKKTNLPTLAAPALRALSNAKIATIKDLTKYTEKEISVLHGMGPNALKQLKTAMRKHKLSYKK